MENESVNLVRSICRIDALHCYRSTLSHERHCVRRRAFSVPHEAQRKYIVRANQEVMIALKPRIAISTTVFRRNSLNLCVSLEALAGKPGRAHSHAETLLQRALQQPVN